ncbi:hypothetical protein XA68_10334 [Ophiocordyceps unilateralis]|uniref:Metallo-beta-lactamase domain-containing protein n=1 Tax=Ophiocordyceps unilateralis TaxID=268505 RepID=A0A2A9NZ45_OPHUN|nr:hypothetical protein XA68_10334 [Ophiocordyceps unilateralis]
MAKPTPDLNIPPSPSTVSVSLINAARIHHVCTADLVQPPRKGHEFFDAPCYVFLVRNTALNRTVIFDLGVRRDANNFSPAARRMIQKGGVIIDVDFDVREILQRQGVDLSEIEAIVWSHWHFDHTGDSSGFGPGTALVVGPGFCEPENGIFPGYPANPDSPILESDYAGRELREVSFADSKVAVGRMSAIDYFGDGSFYLLDAPGHTVGHLCALARVTSSPQSSFILMGGDGCHHMAELRPSPFRPLPHDLDPSPLRNLPVCPGALFEPLLWPQSSSTSNEPDRTRAIYDIATGPNAYHTNPAETTRTIAKLQEVDAADNVFVVIAHDHHLLDLVDFFPATLDHFLVKGWPAASRWRFLADFSLGLGLSHDGLVSVSKVPDDVRPEPKL